VKAPWLAATGIAVALVCADAATALPCQGRSEPPCSRKKARDHAQVAVDVGAAVAPTFLVAEAGLFARERRR
jgi:hypothetical protein